MKFIARQPILNRDRNIYAYELLFRSGIQNSCEGINLDQASASMFDTSFLIGLQRLTGGHRAFINCPRDFLLRDYISLFPADMVVIELLETIAPDEEVVKACRRLKEAGYMLALDDFVDTPDWAPLVDMADFIKVDFRATAREEQRALAARYAAKGIRMLAEKVETPEEHSEGVDMGYSLFQGYFFCRPEIVRQREVPSLKLAYLELLQSATASEFDINALAGKIKHEPSLTFKLLRYLNSAAFGISGGNSFHPPRAQPAWRTGTAQMDRRRFRWGHGGRKARRADDRATCPGTILRTGGSAGRAARSRKRSVLVGSTVGDGCDPRSAPGVHPRGLAGPAGN